MHIIPSGASERQHFVDSTRVVSGDKNRVSIQVWRFLVKRFTPLVPLLNRRHFHLCFVKIEVLLSLLLTRDCRCPGTLLEMGKVSFYLTGCSALVTQGTEHIYFLHSLKTSFVGFYPVFSILYYSASFQFWRPILYIFLSCKDMISKFWLNMICRYTTITKIMKNQKINLKRMNLSIIIIIVLPKLNLIS